MIIKVIFSCLLILSIVKPVIYAQPNSQLKQAVLKIRGAAPRDLNTSKKPARIYISNPTPNEQQGPLLVLEIWGLKPDTKIYWSYKQKRHPLNDTPFFFEGGFSVYPDHPLDRIETSTRANKQGISRVYFRGSTFAGDSFRFAVSLKARKNLQERFHRAPIKSDSYTQWKRFALESPKILHPVHFPQKTWKWLEKGLERINIELTGSRKSIPFKPGPGIMALFQGKKEDKRYGPKGSYNLQSSLRTISDSCNDGNPGTVNIFILGAFSRDSDLIKKGPQPVDYKFPYKPKHIDLNELSSYGTGIAMDGQNPSIFIWSDFWWVYSRRAGADHSQALARAILHEIGHHLLHFKTGNEKELLNNQGHLNERYIQERVTIPNFRTNKNILYKGRSTNFQERFHSKRSIMSGYQFVPLSEEKSFIKKPLWHPEIQRLIRRD